MAGPGRLRFRWALAAGSTALVAILVAFAFEPGPTSSAPSPAPPAQAQPGLSPPPEQPPRAPPAPGSNAAPTRRPRLLAPPLHRGDRVAIVSPATALLDSQTRAMTRNLEKRGYEVRLFGERDVTRGYLAASDTERAAAFNAAVSDPAVKAIICARGGYGSPRILDRIDYAALARSPKVLIGYSDITALLIAVEQRCGLVTFHGPMGKEWSAARGISPYSELYYWDLFSGDSLEPAKLADWGGELPSGLRRPVTLAPGVAEGVLVGGNLSVVTCAIGTPYAIETEGAILFLEEVGERPFHIDRMLNQLRLAGKLQGVKGVLLGVFAACQTRDPEGDLSLEEVFGDYLTPLGVPVLYEYPAGHVPDQATLPIGSRVRLDATERTLSILEPCVAPPAQSESEGVPRPDGGI